jgi:four helix bundle protein
MGNIKRFEDLEVWQKARELANAIYYETQKGSFSKDFSLRDQINKSAGSIMDNIAEGFERGGTKEFLQFLSIAKASCAEVRSQLYRAKDRNHLDESFEMLLDRAAEISKQLAGFIKYLRSSEMRGSKYINEPFADYFPETNFES